MSALAVVALIATSMLSVVSVPAGSVAAEVPQYEIPIRSTDVIARDVAYDAVGRRLYVVEGGTAAERKLVTVDPASASAVAVQSVGASPTLVEVSDDGSALYVATDDGAFVRKFSLPSLTPEWSYQLPLTTGGVLHLQQYMVDMKVVPGSADSIVIAFGTGASGLVVVDHGVARPVTVPSDGAIRVAGITFGATSDVLYVAGSSGARAFATFRLASDGISEDVSGGAEIPTFDRQIAYHAGSVYYPNGTTVDVTVSPPALRTGPEYGPIAVAVDPVTGTLLRGTDTAGGPGISVWDLISLAPVRDWVLPPQSFTPSTIIPLGNGLTALVDSYSRVLGIADLAPPPVYGALGEYTALTPVRILDTRTGVGTGGSIARIGADQTLDVQITGAGGVPVSGVDTVVMNVTAVSPTQAGFLTVYPTGIERPTTSSLNFGPGVTVANLVTMPLGDDGRVSIYNPFGDVDVLFDVSGFYASTDGPVGARFQAMRPERLLDTRNPNNPVTTLGPGGSGQIPVSGWLDCCPVAVVLNVTVTAPTAPSFVSVFPSDVERPVVSNLNFTAGATLANQVIVRRPESGMITIYNEAGAADVIVDIVGYFTMDKRFEHGRFVSFEPFRAIDTRVESPFDPPGDLWPGDIIYWGQEDEPLSAFVTNVTVTQTSGYGFVTAYPYDPGYTIPPHTSTVNYSPGQTVPNHAIVGTLPYIGFFNDGGYAHLVVDIVGGFT